MTDALKEARNVAVEALVRLANIREIFLAACKPVDRGLLISATTVRDLPPWAFVEVGDVAQLALAIENADAAITMKGNAP